jgi:hypothetical protein
MQSHIVLKPSSNLSLTVSTAAVSLTETDIPNNVVGATLTVENADVRMRYDGTDPVGGAVGGLKMVDGSVWEVEGRDILKDMVFIRDSGTDANLNFALISGH